MFKVLYSQFYTHSMTGNFCGPTDTACVKLSPDFAQQIECTWSYCSSYPFVKFGKVVFQFIIYFSVRHTVLTSTTLTKFDTVLSD